MVGIVPLRTTGALVSKASVAFGSSRFSVVHSERKALAVSVASFSATSSSTLSSSASRRLALNVRFTEQRYRTLSSPTPASLPPPTSTTGSSLHKSIQAGLLHGSSSAAAANSGAIGTASNNVNPYAKSPEQLERNRRTQQAAINAVCSFMVVLLAAQSYKSGIEKRKAELHLEAALEVLTEAQDKLKLVLDESVSQTIAQVTLEELARDTLNATTRTGASKAWFWTSSRGESTTSAPTLTHTASSSTTTTSTGNNDTSIQNRVAGIIQGELQRVVGDAALSATERDQRYLHELAVAASATTATTVTGDADADQWIHEAGLLSNQNTLQTNESTGSATKKRVFSM